MKKTKINGNPGFGIPSDMGETGGIGKNVYFADQVLYELIDQENEIGHLDSSLITFEYYNGKFDKYIEKEEKIIYFKIANKPVGVPFKEGDTVMVNTDRCCFFNVILNIDGTMAFIDNSPKYKISLSPIKMINFSFTASLSASSQKRIILYPSLITDKNTLIHNFHIEVIHGTSSADYSKSLSEFASGGSTEIELPQDFPSNQKEKARIYVYAVCNTNTMGMKEYLIGTEEVGI